MTEQVISDELRTFALSQEIPEDIKFTLPKGDIKDRALICYLNKSDNGKEIMKRYNNLHGLPNQEGTELVQLNKKYGGRTKRNNKQKNKRITKRKMYKKSTLKNRRRRRSSSHKNRYK